MKNLNTRKLSLVFTMVSSSIFWLGGCTPAIEGCTEPFGEPYLTLDLLDNTQEIDSIVAFVDESLPTLTYLPGADTAIGVSMNHERLDLTVYHRTGPTELAITYVPEAFLDEACGIHYFGLLNVRVQVDGPISFTDVFNPFVPESGRYDNQVQIFLFP